MKDGKCTKHYPRPFSDETVVDENCYPVYKRSNNGRTFIKNNFECDNRWIVPYNPYLSAKYDAHINIEIATSITSVKYLYKYVYKGGDRAFAEIQVDETKMYIDGRYISAPEGKLLAILCPTKLIVDNITFSTASWRIFQFSTHQHSPSVVRLQLHLPDQQMILFDPDSVTSHGMLHRPKLYKTNLTEFFVACRQYPEARMLTYPKMPQEFVWDNGKKEWKPRKKGKAIGRVYFAGPAAGERYYLRMLLYIVPGPTSWEALRTVNGVVHDTFKAACAAHGLLETDDEFDRCLEEAATMQTGKQLRHLFAIILLECAPSSPTLLWKAHAQKLSDDCKRRLEHQDISNPTDEQILSLALHDLNEILLRSGKNLQDFGLPLPNHTFETFHHKVPRVIAEETTFNQQMLNEMWQRCLKTCNKDQHTAFEAVMAAYEAGNGGIFFIDGPGGTGKTFVENMILAKVRSDGNIALAVASSGIAAVLLNGGRTAHSRFKIPINIQPDSCCSITAQSDLAQLLRQTKVIIWDEAPMQHRYLAEAVSRTLQDIRKCDDQPFGGVLTIFAGKYLHIIFFYYQFKLTYNYLYQYHPI